MNEYELLKERIMELVAMSKNQRMLSRDANQTLMRKLDISTFTVNEAVEQLVKEGDLVYANHDSYSYVEIPCNGCDGGHRAARPMQVVTDGNGNRWLCDKGINSNMNLKAQGCWRCEDVAFPMGGR